MQFISALLADAWPYVVGLIGLVATYFGIRQSGANAANRKNKEKERKAADETRNRIEATKPAADADAARNRLHDRQSK